MSGVDTAVILSLALVAAAGAASAFGAVQAGNAQKAAASRQAQIDQQNADVAAQDRITNIKTAQLNQADKARSDQKQTASLLAAYGSSGLELAGSPLDVIASTTQDMALDERRIGFQGDVQGRNDALKIIGYDNAADTATAAGQQAQTAGYIGAGADLLGGAAKVAGGVSKASSDTPKTPD